MELLRFTQRGWPTCCGEVMTFEAAPSASVADETKPDHPPLPSS
jgi:hypothetical protein